MMTVTLSDEARQSMAVFESVTGVAASDCVFDEDRVVFVVDPDEIGTAIGSGGSMVERLEAELGQEVRLIEGAEDPGAFVANALAPAAVYNVTISENDDRVAYAEVDHDDRGVAIGEDGRNIELARRLADRHFDVDDVQLA